MSRKRATDGKLSTSGLYGNDAKDVRKIIHRTFKEEAKELAWNAETFPLRPRWPERWEGLRQPYLQYAAVFPCQRDLPLHFMWETGLKDTFSNILEDASRQPRFEGWVDSMKERFSDLLDEAIELGARMLGRPMWREMKEDAERASVSRRGGAALVARHIA